jgi:anaphase-promoting complex subunit 6
VFVIAINSQCSKTSLMDPRFAPAWIAFGHTFAVEGEHDHAITAYSTAARLFQGSHLPLLFVGMEHIQLANELMAEEALAASMLMCDSDPLVWNEQGVLSAMRKQCVFQLWMDPAINQRP